MKINSLDSLGYLKEYDVILTFYSDEFDKDYIVDEAEIAWREGQTAGVRHR